jgi:hypothetical protein
VKRYAQYTNFFTYHLYNLTVFVKASLDSMSDTVRQSPLDKQVLLLVQQKLCQSATTSNTVDSKLLQSTVINAVLAYNGESLYYSDDRTGVTG